MAGDLQTMIHFRDFRRKQSVLLFVVTCFLYSEKVAEGQGFEPWDVLPSLVFKTSAFDHSATPPVGAINATKTTAPVRAQV